MAETLHALVLNGQFVESRMVDPETVPAHKFDTDGGLLLRPFIDAPMPEHEHSLEIATSELQVVPEEVWRVWTITRRPIEEQIAAIRNECGRRIYTPFPQWKQANYTARAAELIEKKADGIALSPEETVELAALRSVWDWIKAVRAASDVLEAMETIPVDYRGDAHWPAEWGT